MDASEIMAMYARLLRLSEPESYKAAQQRYKDSGKKSLAMSARQRQQKEQCLAAYGQQCVRCGFPDIRALSIDHIDGGGSQHRREIRRHFYRWLIANNFPPGFQTLCMNCQFIKRHENQEWTSALI